MLYVQLLRKEDEPVLDINKSYIRGISRYMQSYSRTKSKIQ